MKNKLFMSFLLSFCCFGYLHHLIGYFNVIFISIFGTIILFSLMRILELLYEIKNAKKINNDDIDSDVKYHLNHLIQQKESDAHDEALRWVINNCRLTEEQYQKIFNELDNPCYD